MDYGANPCGVEEGGEEQGEMGCAGSESVSGSPAGSSSVCSPLERVFLPRCHRGEFLWASTHASWAGTARVTPEAIELGFEGCRDQIKNSPSHDGSATSPRALHPFLTFICRFMKFTNSAGPSQQSKSSSFVPRICFDNYSEANWYICSSNFIQLLN